MKKIVFSKIEKKSTRMKVIFQSSKSLKLKHLKNVAFLLEQSSPCGEFCAAILMVRADTTPYPREDFETKIYAGKTTVRAIPTTNKTKRINKKC